MSVYTPTKIRKNNKTYYLKRVTQSPKAAMEFCDVERKKDRHTAIHRVMSNTKEAWGVFVREQ